MHKFIVLLSLTVFTTSLWGQFSWGNYKYILIDCESEIVLKTFRSPETTLAYGGIPNPIRLAFDDYNPSNKSKKSKACAEITEDQFKYLNRFETAVAFGKIRFESNGKVSLSIYDATSDWDSPVWRRVGNPLQKGFPGVVYSSSSVAIANYLKNRARVSRSFDEASSNAYFDSVEISAEEFLKLDPYRTGSISQEKIVYENVLFESKLVVSEISSVFVLSTASQSCEGVESDAQGLATIVSLKLMPHFNILERSNLDQVLEEQKLSLSGITDESTVLSLGKIQGSDGVVFCQETCVSGQQMQTVKLLDCNTGEQQWIATGFGGNPLDLMDAIIQEIK